MTNQGGGAILTEAGTHITHMKKAPTKKARKPRNEQPLEFDRGWQELEAQHDRLKTDWMSLAAQLGAISRGRAF